MPFEFQHMENPDVILVKPTIFKDQRGFFIETYKKTDFKNAGIDTDFVQDNYSKSGYGVLRGLHFQREPYAQAKLVICIKGKVFDVAVDLRKNSSYFGRYVSAELSGENKHMLFIPRGFAHGFLVLSEEAEVMYRVDNVYSSGHESGLIWNDNKINIKWPKDNPLLSQKDKELPSLNELI